MDIVFTELFAEVVEYANIFEIDEVTPRITGRQRNRANAVSKTPEQHYGSTYQRGQSVY